MRYSNWQQNLHKNSDPQSKRKIKNKDISTNIGPFPTFGSSKTRTDCIQTVDSSSVRRLKTNHKASSPRDRTAWHRHRESRWNPGRRNARRRDGVVSPSSSTPPWSPSATRFASPSAPRTGSPIPSLPLRRRRESLPCGGETAWIRGRLRELGLRSLWRAFRKRLEWKRNAFFLLWFWGFGSWKGLWFWGGERWRFLYYS